ncbi:GntR family transcriptional regulator [Paraburkholderia tagetis]|uniref:GntR family transcriptional regulator n=1 Tax=Paraburkholderia tagetis TaxID=2913261 RepID=A0A9X2A134_9BURK|nr:GntR family transcriptional regulator [Paraburkholderia tagetis]MCG5078425.1 GntR family transcriptional regulator [Paraburkholderia tagetis]
MRDADLRSASHADEATPLALVREHSLTDLVRDEIERCIAGGTLVPGAKLVESEWAARLQVSRGPVREAFRALEQAGLVRNEKHRGAYVRSVPDTEARELALLCSVLEEAACRMLAARIDAAQVAALRDRLDAMRSALADDSAFACACEAFRDALVEAAGNGKLREAHRRAVNEWRLSTRVPQTAAMRQASYTRHRAVLNALASRDADEAAARMRAQEKQDEPDDGDGR